MELNTNSTRITYFPRTPTNWSRDTTGYTVASAFDELSQRMTAEEGEAEGTGTDDYLVRWDGTKGLQDSHVACLDNGNLTTDSDAWAIYGHNSLAGHGGSITVAGGAGINYGHNGGDLTLRGGSSIYSTPGTLTLGDANTKQVDIGNGTTPVNITGTQTWAGANVDAGGLAITNVGNVDGRRSACQGAVT